MLRSLLRSLLLRASRGAVRSDPSQDRRPTCLPQLLRACLLRACLLRACLLRACLLRSLLRPSRGAARSHPSQDGRAACLPQLLRARVLRAGLLRANLRLPVVSACGDCHEPLAMAGARSLLTAPGLLESSRGLCLSVYMRPGQMAARYQLVPSFLVPQRATSIPIASAMAALVCTARSASSADLA